MRAATAAMLLFLLVLTANAGASDDLLQEGARIYNAAMRSDGTPIPATVQFDVSLSPAQAACVGCHRRSGLGIAEGGNRTQNITGPHLFSAVDVTPARPAYTEQTLTRAIVAGIAADGRPLDDLMPRYQLSATDAEALITYLRQLGAAASPGVSADTLTIATIIAPDAPIYEQQAVEAVVARFIEIKNAGTRNDVARAAAAERHEFGVNRYRAYRRWEHTFWHLRGEPSTWHAQLESLYAEATPFALVSGAAGNLWSVIHQFCEDHQLPCVLPAGDAPGADDSDFYSLYFSSGVTLEAEVAAKHLATVRADDAKQVLLVHSDDESGNAAAAAFKRLWPAKQGAVAEVPLRAGMIPKSTRWRTYLTGKPTRFVVAFVSPGQLQSLMRALAGQEHAPELVYTAESMSSWASMTENMPLLTRIMHVYPYALSTGEQGQFAREEEWLRSQGLGSMEEISAAKALFACHVFGEAMSDIKTNLSRDYLMESFEHALDGTQMTSIYPRTTMGPSQRLLARGAYVTGIVPDSAGNRLVSVEWIQP